MKAKRSRISPERLKDLQQHNAVYVISCGVEGCPCQNAVPACERGFFSLFLQAVYGIAFAEKNNLPYYINFGNCQYLYSDPAKGERNFWNYYFLQPLPQVPGKSTLVPNLFNEVFPLRIWDRWQIAGMNQAVVSRLQFTDEVKQMLEKHVPAFQNQNVLGVQIRCTDHSNEISPVSITRILKEIDRKIKEHDKLFVATDDSSVILLLKERYGNRLIYHEAERSGNEDAVHLNRSIKDRYRLGLEVLLDCYCLSLCRHAVLMQSNISYAALLFNPNLPYTLLERAEVKYKRAKTLFLYYLDKFGIRKW